MVPEGFVFEVLAQVDTFRGLESRQGRVGCGSRIPGAIGNFSAFHKRIQITLANISLKPVEYNLRDVARILGSKSYGALGVVSIACLVQLDDIPCEYRRLGSWVRVAWVEASKLNAGKTKPELVCLFTLAHLGAILDGEWSCSLAVRSSSAL